MKYLSAPKLTLAAVLCATVFATPVVRAEEAANEETTLKALLANRDLPLSLKMGALDSSWRRFTVSGNSATDIQWQMLGARAGLEFGVHYTKGQTVTLGGETYLVAYRPSIKIDPRILNWHGHGDPPRPRKPTSETEMSLSLLNLRTTGSLSDLRAFEPKTDIIDTTSANADAVRTLQQLGQGVMRYIRARGVLPYLGNPVPWDANRVFYPYVGDERLYMHPATQETFRWNEILSGKKVAHIQNPQSMAVFYEATPAGDGTRGILFLDGHVERLSSERWQTIKRASKITNDGSETNEDE